MTNPRLKSILVDMMEDEKKEKICLIEDIMKAGRLLAGAENKLDSEVLTDPAKVFDRLYELPIPELQEANRVISDRLTIAILGQMNSLIKDIKNEKL